jgi:hypothetical protein
MAFGAGSTRMFGLFGSKGGTHKFWDWLAANTDRIQSNFKQDPQSASEEIRRAFRRSYPDLTWEVSPSKTGPWLFCISADGNPKLFPKVELAIQDAPEVPGWKIQAFRPRGSLTAEIDMGGKKLGYDDIWCSVQAFSGGVRVKLWIRGLNPQSDRILSPAAAILLDNAVGEYDAVMKIKELDRGPLPANPQRTDEFFPLVELPRFMDSVESS